MPYGQGFEIDCQYLLILNAFTTKNNKYANFSSTTTTTTTTTKTTTTTSTHTQKLIFPNMITNTDLNLGGKTIKSSFLLLSV